jgi:methylated-DNA-protein-cysteine methyltransferase-like protein
MDPVQAFRDSILALVVHIPHGHVATYGQLARMAGYPRRPRQVGMVLKGLPEDTRLPWHRVVNAQGQVPSRGRFWGALEQIDRLRREGVKVSDEGSLELDQYQWRGDFTPGPQE